MLAGAWDQTVSTSTSPPDGGWKEGRRFDESCDVPVVWKPGDLLLRLYEVRAVLGEGGMGRVYRVRPRGWNTDLAVKTPRPEKLRTEEQKRAFERECEALVNLG